MELLVGEDDGVALVVADDRCAGALGEEAERVRRENGRIVQLRYKMQH